MNKKQLIDECNELHRQAFELDKGSFLFLPHSRISIVQLEIVRINLQNAKLLLERQRRIEADAAQKYPEMAKIVRNVIGYLPYDDEDGFSVAWLECHERRVGMWMRDWKNEVVI